MSRPGSLRWWQDTALITLAGAGLAAWLWDGPVPFNAATTPSNAPGTMITGSTGTTETTPNLGDYVDAGCLSGDDLRAMVEGRALPITCPPAVPVLLRDLPPEQRPFP